MKKSIFEKNVIKKLGYTLPETAIDEYTVDSVSESLLRENPLDICSVDEQTASMHFRELLSYESDVNKTVSFNGARYIRSVTDEVSRLDGFTGVHAYQLSDAGQGALELLFTLGHMVSDMFGMDLFSFQSVTKKQAMFTMLAVAKAYFKENNANKNVILASKDVCKCALRTANELGYEIKLIDATASAVENALDENVAVLLIKNPSADGQFITDISKIVSMAKEKEVITCCDATDTSSLIGIIRPGDIGFDMMCFDMSEAFAISNSKSENSCVAVGARGEYSDYLPAPTVDMDDEEQYFFNYDRPKSIGKINVFYGDFIAWIKALSFILTTGFEGFKEISEASTLNASYLKYKLSGEKGFVLNKFTVNDDTFKITESLDKNDIDVFASDYKN